MNGYLSPEDFACYVVLAVLAVGALLAVVRAVASVRVRGGRR